jgi:hypothetical protein
LLRCFYRMAAFVCVCILAGCSVLPETATPPATSLPETIVIHPQGEDPFTLTAGQSTEALSTLEPILDDVTARARTVFSPERFATEIAPSDHIYLRFASDVTFAGVGMQWTAAEVVVTVLEAEVMLLGRQATGGDWQLYTLATPSDAQGQLELLYSLVGQTTP